MADHIASTRIRVEGVSTDDDVKAALQALYDRFAEMGLGQATFEITDAHTEVVVKHRESVTPDVDVIDEALRAAGNFRVA